MTEHITDSSEQFSFRTNREGVITIFWSGRPVTVLRGKAAVRFLTRVEGRDAPAVQLEMARVTGSFKRGNERTAKSRERSKS